MGITSSTHFFFDGSEPTKFSASDYEGNDTLSGCYLSSEPPNDLTLHFNSRAQIASLRDALNEADNLLLMQEVAERKAAAQ